MRLIDADKLLEETRKDRDYAEKNGFLDMYYERQALIDRIESQSTAYDVDKVVEKLEEIRAKKTCNKEKCDTKEICRICVVDDAIEIVKQGAERCNGGWISCSERLPEEAFGCLVTVIDCEPSTQTDFENILPYFVGYDGETWNDADGKEIPFEVIAWMPLPKPYKESD